MALAHIGIVAKAQRGDAEAHEELAKQAAMRLYPIALRILRDSDLADECVQRALVAIWQQLPDLRDHDRFEAWSYRLLVRFCWAELRKSQRLVRGGAVLEVVPDTRDETAAVVDRDELERAFGQLSTEHRAVLILTYYRGLSGNEVARALGVSPGTVASRVHYALRHLRSVLDADRRGAVQAA